MWIHNILAASNIFGLPAVILAYHRQHVGNALVIVAAIFASVMMHLSETKHSLEPMPPLKTRSLLFLNVDRTVAMLTFLWFLPQWSFMLHGVQTPLIWLASGTIAMALGELCLHPLPYLALHLFWHFAVYRVLSIVA